MSVNTNKKDVTNAIQPVCLFNDEDWDFGAASK